jgi:hypothetical protein
MSPFARKQREDACAFFFDLTHMHSLFASPQSLQCPSYHSICISSYAGEDTVSVCLSVCLSTDADSDVLQGHGQTARPRRNPASRPPVLSLCRPTHHSDSSSHHGTLSRSDSSSFLLASPASGLLISSPARTAARFNHFGQ